jgi:hypothetical protein
MYLCTGYLSEQMSNDDTTKSKKKGFKFRIKIFKNILKNDEKSSDSDELTRYICTFIFICVYEYAHIYMYIYTYK